jgi:proliferating cell nuclear antigen
MIELKEVTHFQRAVRAISAFISEGNLRFRREGMYFKAIDPSQIVLVNYFAPKTFFDKYSVEPGIIGVDLEELNKVVRRAKPRDTMTIAMDDANLKITLKGTLVRKFNISLIDVPHEEVQVQSKGFDGSVVINAGLLQEVLKDAALFGSSITLHLKKRSLTFEAQGPQGTMRSIAKHSKEVEISANKEVTSKFSLSFFENIVKEALPEQNIKLELKADAPMKISFDIDKSKIEYYLAYMIL